MQTDDVKKQQQQNYSSSSSSSIMSSSSKKLHAEEGLIDHHAEDLLAELGYEQELPRTLSMMSILGLSFAIMVC